MDTNKSYQLTPKVGHKIRVTCYGLVGIDGLVWEGVVVHVFPANQEIPEELMRKYYQPQKGSKYDKDPTILTRPGRYDRVVVDRGEGAYRIHPHQRYYEYEVIS